MPSDLGRRLAHGYNRTRAHFAPARPLRHGQSVGRERGVVSRQHTTLRFLYRIAGPLEALLDLMAWSVAAAFAVYMRYDFHLTRGDVRSLLKFVPIVAVVQLTVGLASGLYRKRWRYGSFDEVAALIAAALVTTLILFAVDRWYLRPRFPLSAVLMKSAT